MNGRPWTEPDLRRLRIYYPDVPTAALARVMGRTVCSIHGKAFSMGLRKSAAFFNSSASGRTDGKRGLSSRFAPGLSPWNKGMEGLHIPGCEAGHFKKGHRPQTWVPVGTEVFRMPSRRHARGYLYRKISDDQVPARFNWKLVHLLLWEKHHGPAPAGHAVIFRNGNTRDIRIENLELISRRDLMRRNTIHNLPPAVKAVITMKGALNRTITIIGRRQREREQHPGPASASV